MLTSEVVFFFIIYKDGVISVTINQGLMIPGVSVHDISNNKPRSYDPRS